MTTTVFSTPCCKNAHRLEPRLRHNARWLRWQHLLGVAWLWLACGIFGLQLVQAQGVTPDITQLKIERTEDGVFLSAQVNFELSGVVEEALLKGIPVFFVAEVQLNRERWYWYDRNLGNSSRQLRLAYQPLTRRWRLNSSSGPAASGGLGVALNQNFDSLADALAALQRISRWKVAEASEIEPDARHSLDFRFRLDVSQLARPLQIGVLGQPDWNINLSRSLRLNPEVGK